MIWLSGHNTFNRLLQPISKGKGIMECKLIGFYNLSQRVQELWSVKDSKSVIRGGNSNIKTVRVTILVCNMPPLPVLHTYQISAKYLKGSWRYGMLKILWFHTEMGGENKAVRVLFLHVTHILDLSYISTKYYQIWAIFCERQRDSSIDRQMDRHTDGCFRDWPWGMVYII